MSETSQVIISGDEFCGIVVGQDSQQGKGKAVFSASLRHNLETPLPNLSAAGFTYQLLKLPLFLLFFSPQSVSAQRWYPPHFVNSVL